MIRLRVLIALCLLPVAAGSMGQKRSQTGIFGAGQPGEVSVVRMEAKKLGLKNFEMQSRQVDGRLAIDAFSARLGSGMMQGRGLIDWSQPDNQQHMSIQVQNVEVMALLEAFSVKLDAQISGMSNAVIDTQWRGVRGATPRQTMNGSVKIQVGPGQIAGAEALQQVASYTGIASLQQLRFNSAVLEGVIRDGMMSITKFDINGGTAQATGVGLLDLRTEQVKIKITGGVRPELLGQSTFPQVRALSKAATMVGGGDFVKLPLNILMRGQIRDPAFDISWITASQDKSE